MKTKPNPFLRFTLRFSAVAFPSAPAVVMLAVMLASPTVQAAPYTYSGVLPNTAPGGSWLAGDDWDNIPVSAADTTLNFTGTLDAGATIFTNNDIPGTFLLNRMNFTQAGPGTGTAPVVTVSGNPLEFVSNGPTLPTLNFGTTGTIRPVVALSNNLILTNDITVIGGGNATLSGVISGGGSFTKTNTGAITLSNANTFTGATTLSNGGLILTNTDALGGTSEITVAAGASLGLAGGTTAGAGKTVTISGLGFFASSSGALTSTSGNNTWAGNVILGSTDARFGVANTAANSTDSLTVSGVISSGVANSGATIRTAVSSEIVTFSGQNSYTGPTRIVVGTLSVSNIGSVTTDAGLGTVHSATSNLGAAADAAGGTIIFGNAISNSASVIPNLRYTGTGEVTDRSLLIESGTTVAVTATINQSGASGNLKFVTAPTFTGDATKVLALAGSTTGTGEIAATLSNGTGTGVVAVNKSGSGTWTLSSANSYTGSTTVSGGILSISNALALGDTTGSTTVTGGSLSLTGGITVTGEAITINGIGTNSSGALRNGGGNNTWTGDVFLGASGGTGTNNAARIGAVSGTITVSGTIQDGATRNVGVRNADGAGTTIFSGQNTYTGATHIVVGPLRVGSLNSVETNPVLGTVKSASSNLGAPTSVEDGTIHFSSGAAVVGQLIYTGTGETTDRVLNLFGTTTGAVLNQSGTGLLKFTSALTATGLGNKTLALQGSTSGTGEIAGAIVNSTGFATSVSKAGTSTWTLSGANTYSGSTTVTGGVMVVSGGINSTTSLSVTGGTFRLGASDVVADAATVTLGTGGVLQTNNFSDILGVLAVSGNATVNLTGTSVIQFANSSVPSWSGMLTISGWSGLAAGDGAERLVFGSDTSGLTPDQLSRITFNNPEGFAAGNYGAAILASGEIVPLIPEPSAVMLALTSTCGLFLRRRRGAGRA